MCRDTLCIISPCRDEAEYARTTITSVLAQTKRPDLWIIVDDGSTDATPDILREYEEEYSFIRVIRRIDRGTRSVGPGVVDAFYAGLKEINLEQFEFICKLDLDLKLPNKYFEKLIARMRQNPKLGTCSGKPYIRHKNGALVPERIGDEMSAGMTKLYRTSCFQEIGGFVREVMWDGIDCHRCRMLGWDAESVDEDDLRFEHLRVMGSSYKSVLHGRTRHGYGQYFMGTGMLYMTVSAIYRMRERPVIIGGLCILFGYLKSALKRAPRYNDLQFRKFLREFQRYALLHGKNKAVRLLRAGGR